MDLSAQRVYTASYNEGMAMGELVLWWVRWVWAAVQEAFWNYLTLWIPLGVVLLLVKVFCSRRVAGTGPKAG
jgi:hypothetical protein